MATHCHVETASGPMLVIDMQSYPDLAMGRHVHSCPKCYEHVPCGELCSVEPDLTLDDGTLRGAYVECIACESQRSGNTKEGK